MARRGARTRPGAMPSRGSIGSLSGVPCPRSGASRAAGDGRDPSLPQTRHARWNRALRLLHFRENGAGVGLASKLCVGPLHAGGGGGAPSGDDARGHARGSGAAHSPSPAGLAGACATFPLPLQNSLLRWISFPGWCMKSARQNCSQAEPDLHRVQLLVHALPRVSGVGRGAARASALAAPHRRRGVPALPRFPRWHLCPCFGIDTRPEPQVLQ